MFDPEKYRNACGRLTLGAEKLEEMIAMTENKRKAPKGVLRTALIAAACVAALCVTAFAAVPAVREFFGYTITIQTGDDAAPIALPTMQLEDREGRSILTVDGEEIDVTDAFAKDGKYAFARDGAAITVSADGWVDAQTADGEPISVSYNLFGKSRADGDVQAPAELPHPNADEVQEQYTVLPGSGGAMNIYDSHGNLVETDLPGSVDVPAE